MSTNKQRKLSEILKLAMPSYVEFIKKTEISRPRAPLGNMCCRLLDLHHCDDLITKEECDNAVSCVQAQIEECDYLSTYLKYKGRKTTAAAQIQFYQKWIKQLEREGK